jgi:hypothetical protein
MKVTDEQLDAFISSRSLVCIRRERIDARSLQAVPIRYSPTLLLVQYVYDFHLDGQLILRRSNISSMSCRATDEFQRGLLVDHGLIDQIDFHFHADLASFANLLDSQPALSIVILEGETVEDSDFWIGRYVDSTDDLLRLHEFTGAGTWDDKLTYIRQTDVTCCQLNTNYIRFYAQYFETHTPPRGPA